MTPPACAKAEPSRSQLMVSGCGCSLLGALELLCGIFRTGIRRMQWETVKVHKEKNGCRLLFYIYSHVIYYLFNCIAGV